jgi:hypothetical protein
MPITDDVRIKFAKNRDKLMYAVFYRYASSSDDNPVAGKHNVTQAVGAWSSFWVFVEGIAYFTCGALVAWLFDSRSLGLSLLATSVILFVLACLQYVRLEKYSIRQIESIVSDKTAVEEIENQFNALQTR